MDFLLNTIKRYISLSPQDETIIRSLFRKQDLDRGDHLLQAGDVCKNIFFIDTGLVRYYTTIEGEEKTNYFNKEGEFVCNYASFLPQQPGQYPGPGRFQGLQLSHIPGYVSRHWPTHSAILHCFLRRHKAPIPQPHSKKIGRKALVNLGE